MATYLRYVYAAMTGHGLSRCIMGCLWSLYTVTASQGRPCALQCE